MKMEKDIKQTQGIITTRIKQGFTTFCCFLQTTNLDPKSGNTDIKFSKIGYFFAPKNERNIKHVIKLNLMNFQFYKLYNSMNYIRPPPISRLREPISLFKR